MDAALALGGSVVAGEHAGGQTGSFTSAYEKIHNIFIQIIRCQKC